MKRVIQSEIDNELANLFLQGEIRPNSTVFLDFDPERDRLVFETVDDDSKRDIVGCSTGEPIKVELEE
jgi:hypothetical protein